MDKHRNNMQHQGFTLVELSIVIIIIGFLIAGISSGTSLIKQAKINGLINEIKEIETAINTFKAVYDGYFPGDFPNATAYWPSEVCIQAGNPISCDGNGNGRITGSEIRFAWDHLNQAKMLSSTFFPSTSPTMTKQLRYDSKAYMQIYSWSTQVYAQDHSNINSLDIFNFSSYLFTPIDAYNIDSKMDDGNPSNGRILTFGEVTPVCVVGPDGVTAVDSYSYTNSDAQYALSNNVPACFEILYTLD